MVEPQNDPVEKLQQSRRLRDAAWFLPIVGMFLFLTPIPFIFSGDIQIFGAPLLFVFIYGAWLALILVSRYLVRRIGEETHE